MSQIFFSYSRKDSDFIDQLIEELEERGVDVWVDRGDILAGEAWRRSIVEAIITCKVFVIALSPNSVESENVAKELTLAEQHKKRVLPLVIKDVQIPPSLDYQLAGLQYQTFVEGSYSVNLERLIRSLGALGVKFDPKIQSVSEPETKAVPLVPQPLDTPEIETTQVEKIEPLRTETETETEDLETKAATPQPIREVQTSQQIDKQPESFQFEPNTNPLKKIPIWLWALGVLVLIVGLVVVLNSVLGKNNEKNLSTATDDVALVLPTSTEDVAVIQNGTNEPTGTPYPLQITDDFGIPMVLVPAGSFLMGTNNSDALKECRTVNPNLNCDAFYFSDEKPARTVDLDYVYYIDQFEVTNERYDVCVTAGVCDPPWNFDLIPGVEYFRVDQYKQYPVVNVTWDAANVYCEWRGGRLPTEMEWEKAARSGVENWLYPWGNDLADDKGNFCDVNCGNSWANQAFNDGYPYTAPVGSFTSGASPFGVEDMAGNVSEWVADKYGPYPNGQADVTSKYYGETRVRRGGSWYSLGSDLRVSRRDKNLPAPQVIDPNSELGKIGFRCVFDVP
jgi:formylglycine-generating enzyme required for sulfatase activity